MEKSTAITGAKPRKESGAVFSLTPFNLNRPNHHPPQTVAFFPQAGYRKR